MESEEQREQVSLSDIFSLKRPRDIRAGVASGLKSVAKGVIGGTVGLVAAPVIGAATHGLTGFASGCATGVAGAVLLPATGVSVAVVQVARGILNQPEAVVESSKGKVWDQAARCWVDRPLSALTPFDGAAARWRQQLPDLASERDLYQLLQVPRDASPTDIKRQYYILARRHHPDKNSGDADAHARFQQLGEAYQVLSNPQLRARYDAHGSDALDVNFMDGAAFYSCLFGSEKFEFLVGELLIATVARCGEGVGPLELQAAQATRVNQLSMLLTALLRRFVEGDVAGFKLAMQQECERLSRASFGVTMLQCIGRCYSRHAEMALGGLLQGSLARVRHGTESLRSHLHVASAALKVMSHQDRLERFERETQQRRQQLSSQRQQQQQGQRQDQPAASATDAGASAAAAAADPAQALDELFWFGRESSSSDGSAAAEMPQHQQQQEPAGPAQHCSSSTEGAAADAAAAPAGSGGAPAAAAGAPDLDAAADAAADADAAAAAAAAEDSTELMNELLTRSQLEEVSMELCMEAMWATNVMDIQATLARVCSAVLHDRSVSGSVRQLRAQALRELGDIFCGASPTFSSGAGQSAKQRVQAAYEALIAKQVAEQQ